MMKHIWFIIFAAMMVLVIFITNSCLKKQNETISASADPIIVEEEREVILDKLIITKTVSNYAHAQHIIWVEGKFKQEAGELYLTIYDKKGNLLQTSGFLKANEVKRLNNEWFVFSHKLIEDTAKKVDIDKGIIVFELRKAGKVIRGELDIPMKRPM